MNQSPIPSKHGPSAVLVVQDADEGGRGGPLPALLPLLPLPSSVAAERPWWLYLIEVKSGALYAGISTDVQARYAAHLAGKGAKFTKANPPVRLVATAKFVNRSEASKAEYQVKQLKRTAKVPFVLAAMG